MSSPLESYLKTYRRRSGLSQDEIAFLLGCRSGAKVSRYEHRVRRPTLETALAYEAIFRVSAKELFAGLYQKVEKNAQSRARLLAKKLNVSGLDYITVRKLAVLRTLSGPVSTGHAAIHEQSSPRP